jgi:hypothetical protein
VAAEFAAVDDADMDDAHFHAFTQRCQAALTQDGALRLAAVGPAVRALLPRIALRDGWKEAMQVGVGGRLDMG